MEQESVLNAHNKEEYPPMHTGGLNTSLMSFFFGVLTMYFCIIGGNAIAQHPKSFPDTIKMFVGEKNINLARTYQGDDMVIYETWENFTEHNTNYIYRALEYWWSDEQNEYRCDTSSYFIISHKQKNHIQNIERVSCQHFWPKTGDEFKDEYHSMCYYELKSQVPILKSHHLGDMPRRWYPLVKYNESYYFSVDQNYVYEFCDSLQIFYGQEMAYFDLNDFRRLDNGGWSNSHTISALGIVKETMVPCKHFKGAYIMTTTIEGVLEERSLWTTDESIKYFDIIDWESTHMNAGLGKYEEIDFDSIQ